MKQRSAPLITVFLIGVTLSASPVFSGVVGIELGLSQTRAMQIQEALTQKMDQNWLTPTAQKALADAAFSLELKNLIKNDAWVEEVESIFPGKSLSLEFPKVGLKWEQIQNVRVTPGPNGTFHVEATLKKPEFSLSEIQAGVKDKNTGKFASFTDPKNPSTPITTANLTAKSESLDISFDVVPDADQKIRLKNPQIKSDLKLDLTWSNPSNPIEIPIQTSLSGEPVRIQIVKEKVEQAISKNLTSFVQNTPRISSLLDERVLPRINAGLENEVKDFRQEIETPFKTQADISEDLAQFTTNLKSTSSSSALPTHGTDTNTYDSWIRDTQTHLAEIQDVSSKEEQSRILLAQATLEMLLKNHSGDFSPTSLKEAQKLIQDLNEAQKDIKAGKLKKKKTKSLKARLDSLLNQAKSFAPSTQDLSGISALQAIERKTRAGAVIQNSSTRTDLQNGKLGLDVAVANLDELPSVMDGNLSAAAACQEISISHQSSSADDPKAKITLDLSTLNEMLKKLFDAGYLDELLGGDTQLTQAPELRVIDATKNKIKMFTRVRRTNPSGGEKLLNGLRRIATLNPGRKLNDHEVVTEFSFGVDSKGGLKIESDLKSIKTSDHQKIANQANLLDFVFRTFIKAPLTLPAYRMAQNNLNTAVDSVGDTYLHPLYEKGVHFSQVTTQMATDTTGKNAGTIVLDLKLQSPESAP